MHALQRRATLPSILQEAASTLGYSLYPEQKLAVTSFVEGNDVFVSLPTGFGKSLCFAILPLVFDGLKNAEKESIVLVVSPLLSIIEDQVSIYRKKGMKVGFAGGDDNSEKEGIKKGEYQIVFISPESLFCTTEWRRMLCSTKYRSNLVGVVVDEAHCIKKWGETFRREFAQLGELRSLVPPNVHVMAMTATATNATRRTIFKSLHMNKPKIIYTKPARDNITYAVAQKTTISAVFDPIIQQLMKERTGMGRMIIFCRQYSEVATIYRYFKRSMGREFTEPRGAPDFSRYRLVEMYTRCTQSYVKKTIVEQFTTSSQLRIVICTIAFGMGINSPDVRVIVHWGVSEDCEMYVQESGRAGRDGARSYCIMYHGKGDLNKKYHSPQIIKYCHNEYNQCRRTILFQDFAECEDVKPTVLCLCCDMCRPMCDCGVCSSNLAGFPAFMTVIP